MPSLSVNVHDPKIGEINRYRGSLCVDLRTQHGDVAIFVRDDGFFDQLAKKVHDWRREELNDHRD